MAARSAKEVDTFICRLLVGKPNASLDEIRRFVPEVRAMDDGRLRQKIDFLKRRVRERAPARR
jgi:hypothetical protein